MHKLETPIRLSGFKKRAYNVGKERWKIEKGGGIVEYGVGLIKTHYIHVWNSKTTN